MWNLVILLKSMQPTIARLMLTGLGTCYDVCQWCQACSRPGRHLLHTQHPCATVVTGEAGRPGVGHPPEEWWNGAAGLVWGPVCYCEQGKQCLSDGAQSHGPRC